MLSRNTILPKATSCKQTKQEIQNDMALNFLHVQLAKYPTTSRLEYAIQAFILN